MSISATAAAEPVRYHVDLTRAREQAVRVRMTLPGPFEDSIDVHLPVWRPGLYLVLDQAGTVRWTRASAVEPAGAERHAEMSKINKSSWRVSGLRDATAVVVEYEVWAASLENRTRHADDTHAFLNPSTVFMYAHERRSSPVEVRLSTPAGWRVATGLPADADGVLRAVEYDRLADSPIEAGFHDLIAFEIDGVPHEIAVWTGEAATPSSEPAPGSVRSAERYRAMPADFAAIIRAQAAIFGGMPYERYVFLVHCHPAGRGGTEHYNSTIVGCTPEAFFDADRYRSFLSLISHEMFHTWNVKRFRPAGMTPYDYQRENYTDLLWVAEGTTTYYEDVILVRAGLMKPAELLKNLAKSIGDLRSRPGAGVQSVADSSYDAWVKFNKRTADAANSTVSFYDKGALVSLVLDMTLRERRGGAASLDTVMRALHRAFPEPTAGYTVADLRRVIGEAAGDDDGWIDRFFSTLVHGTADPDFESALMTVGLTLVGEPPKDDAAWIGVTVSDEGGHAKVTAVTVGSPAADAGIVPGDLIVALDGHRVRAGDLDKRLGRSGPGATARLTLFRHDVLRDLTLAIAASPARSYTIRKADDPTDAQKAAYRSWLGVDW
ncbi:MAG: M61 family metallopeptidase [Phycisphaeraceae bacterium]|nr:MAG: M61 family metallopeptidase [Phycisphaeraceae bacterium]